MRIRITFAKTSHIRFISHLDLHRSWERTFRRSDLPLAYSQGFNPRPKINLASALPLGFTSEAEIADIWLQEDLSLEQVKTCLIEQLPPGIELIQIEIVDLKAPSLQSHLEYSEFEIILLDPYPDLNTRLREILARESIPRKRRGKTYDLRPLILSISPIESGQNDQQRILLRMAARPNATGGPEELLAELDIPIENVLIRRTKLGFAEGIKS
jgi:radical SAM-linked protein